MDHYMLHFLFEKYKVQWILNWVFCGEKLLVLNLSRGSKLRQFLNKEPKQAFRCSFSQETSKPLPFLIAM